MNSEIAQTKVFKSWKAKASIKPHSYVSIPETDSGIRWYYGFDEASHNAFRFEVKINYKLSKLYSSSSISVSTYHDGDQVTNILFSLLDDSLRDIFSEVFLDLVESSKHGGTPSEACKCILSEYERWIKLFSAGRKTGLTEIEQRGLFGELYFIEQECDKNHSISDIILNWSGPDFGEVDFVFENAWTEVKTHLIKEDTITIASVGQLDHPNIGSLVVYALNIDEEGRSLNDQYDIVRSLIKSVGNYNLLEKFENILIEFGYLHLPIYEKIHYSVVETREYAVSDSFPKIPRIIKLPNIKTITYKLIIDSLEEWRIR
ncbi:PD-(D/E)XK motif protein [Sphaerochaeta halotolerans]|nr:PD-(D/E)XK motif protein [Sphaerochaeta halotolerans]MXI86148.1 PD-(D/E)XK motif protein [Sphaerochaeta halotolerans]